MEINDYYLCAKCWWSFLLGDWEHIDNEFTCHRCFHEKNYIHRSKAEYLCEIAFYFWTKDFWDLLSKEIYAIDFDYDDRLCFYEHLLKYVDKNSGWRPLLDWIYKTIDNEKEVVRLRKEFLSTYKK